MSAAVVRTVLTSLKLLELEINFEIASTSFHVCNEKLLLTVLIALLSSISNDFRSVIASSYYWPYHDTKEKNSCKKIILAELQTLSKNGTLAPGCAKSSVLTVAKGPSAWNLLWKVSDALIKKLCFSTPEDPCSLPVSEDSTLSVIQSNIQLEADLIFHQTSSTTAKEKHLLKYSNELTQRLKQATQDIESIDKTLQILESDMGDFLLDDRFKAECDVIIKRISSFEALVEYLLSKTKEKTKAKRTKETMGGESMDVKSRSGIEEVLQQCLNLPPSSCESGSGLSSPPVSVVGALDRLNSHLNENMEIFKSLRNKSVSHKALEEAGGSEELSLQQLLHALTVASKRSTTLDCTLTSLRQKVAADSTAE